eukprot:2054136-Rhodomonas_salina.1
MGTPRICLGPSHAGGAWSSFGQNQGSGSWNPLTEVVGPVVDRGRASSDGKGVACIGGEGGASRGGQGCVSRASEQEEERAVAARAPRCGRRVRRGLRVCRCAATEEEQAVTARVPRPSEQEEDQAVAARASR